MATPRMDRSVAPKLAGVIFLCRMKRSKGRRSIGVTWVMVVTIPTGARVNAFICSDMLTTGPVRAARKSRKNNRGLRNVWKWERASCL